MAGAKGLEPSAFCVTGRRYNQLNYAPEYNKLLKDMKNIWIFDIPVKKKTIKFYNVLIIIFINIKISNPRNKYSVVFLDILFPKLAP